MKNIFILFLFFSLSLFAKIQTTYLVVDGIGQTKTSAIKNALIEAINQTQGIKITAKREYLKVIKEAGSLSNGKSRHSVEISEKSKNLIIEATRGFIKNYSIVSSNNNGNSWNVRLKIKTLKYKTPGYNPNKRRKIAIIPLEYKSNYIVLSKNESGNVISKRLTQSLISKITQSRKFTVLDRENSKYYKDEKNFILSGNSGKNKLLKLGQRLGVDYLLVGQILNFSIKDRTEHNNIGVPEKSQLMCNATISYRILAMATQQIKWSETVSREFMILPNQNSIEALLENVNDKITDVILSNILENIYPLKIVLVTPRSVIVNQGGSSISKGSIFKVYKKAKRLVDPYTKEFLGYEEIKVGEIVITKVDPKVSYARVKYGKVLKNMILRRVKSDEDNKFHSEGQAVSNVKINENGGVVLPF